jgi:predicted transcriptional regulator
MSADSPAPPTLGQLEREVMDVVWDGGEKTVRQIMLALNATSGRQRAYTTVLTVAGNLRRKGVLTCRRQGRSDVYAPALSRQDYTEARARSEVSAVVGRYGDLALAHFAREVAGLDDERRRRLRALLGDD